MLVTLGDLKSAIKQITCIIIIIIIIRLIDFFFLHVFLK